MSELTLTIIKLGFLAVLWLFVLTTVSAIRADLFGTAPKRSPRTPVPKPTRASRNTPTRAVVVAGPDKDLTVTLTDAPVVLGRGRDAGMALSDEYVSTHHARLLPRDGQWYVEDLGSTNGTHVGTARVTDPVQVGTKAQVRLGKTTVELRR